MSGFGLWDDEQTIHPWPSAHYHLITMNNIDLNALMALFNRITPIATDALSTVIASMEVRNLARGEFLLQQTDVAAIEVVVLSGVIKSGVLDSQGRDATLNFFAAPAVVSPAITRYGNDQSRVHLQALTEARTVSFAAEVLNDAMVANREVQCWGETVLRADLMARADKEWALAVLSAKERLQKFRTDFPDLEGTVPHHTIASYLGITPVSLSRIRKQLDS